MQGQQGRQEVNSQFSFCWLKLLPPTQCCQPHSISGKQTIQGTALPGAVADVVLPPLQGGKRLVLWQTCCLSSPSLHLFCPQNQQLHSWWWHGSVLLTILVWDCFFSRDKTWCEAHWSKQERCHSCKVFLTSARPPGSNQRALVGIMKHCTPPQCWAMPLGQCDAHPPFPPHQRPGVISGNVRVQRLMTDQPSGSGNPFPFSASASRSCSFLLHTMSSIKGRLWADLIFDVQGYPVSPSASFPVLKCQISDSLPQCSP